MLASLRTLVLALVAQLSPARPPPDAPAIAEAIAQAVYEDRGRPSVLASHDEDLALLLVTAWEESRLSLHPHAYSHDAIDGTSCGAWQTPCATLPRTVLGQARAALWYLHRGAEICPASPATPYVGGACRLGAGRRIGDARVATARRLLAQYEAASQPARAALLLPSE